MDGFFRDTRESLIKEVKCLCQITREGAQRKERENSIKRIVELAQEIDLVYRIARDGFKKENKRVSERLFSVTQRLFSEMEQKEALLESAKEIKSDGGDLIDRETILEYAERLSKYSKCPLLWTEGVPLEGRLPSFPTDDLLQQSILRAAPKEKKKKEKEKSSTKKEFVFEV